MGGIGAAIAGVAGLFDDILYGGAKRQAQAAHDQSTLKTEQAHDKAALQIAGLGVKSTAMLVRGAELVAIVLAGGLLGWAVLKG